MPRSTFRRRLSGALEVLVAICVARLILSMPGTARANPQAEAAAAEAPVPEDRRSSCRVSPEKTESLLKLINRERSQAGLPELTFHEDLAKVAEQHAVDMVESGYFGHVSPTTGTLASRLKAAGIRFSKAGENLAGCTSVGLAHKLLMESPSHRANILSPRFSEVGVAVVEGGPYGMMIAEVFVSRPELLTQEAPSLSAVPADVVGDDVPDFRSLESPPPSGDSG